MYLKLPQPIFLQVHIANPNMEFMGTLQTTICWQVEVGFLGVRVEG